MNIVNSSHNKYFHLYDHIRFCLFREDIILLDLKKDQYIILDHPYSSLFLYLLQTSFHKNNKVYQGPRDESAHAQFSDDEINDAILSLRQANILTPDDHQHPKTYTYSYANEGVSNVDWQLKKKTTASVSALNILYAYLLLIKVHGIVKLLGFHKLVETLQRCSLKGASKLNSMQDANFWPQQAEALNKACYLFPIRTKCLEWAATLTLLCLKRGVSCQMVVGVQNYHFLAHAWVENTKGEIIADSPEFPRGLSIILKEPATLQ